MTKLTRVGVVGQALVIEHLETGAKVAVPWPMPPPKWGKPGYWEPRVLGEEPDGTKLAVWHWMDVVPTRADEPPKDPKESA